MGLWGEDYNDDNQSNQRIFARLAKDALTRESVYDQPSDGVSTPVSYTHLDVYKRQN